MSKIIGNGLFSATSACVIDTPSKWQQDLTFIRADLCRKCGDETESFLRCDKCRKSLGFICLKCGGESAIQFHPGCV